MTIENSLACSESSVAKSSPKADLNHHILDSINAVSSKPNDVVGNNIAVSNCTDWLPSVGLYRTDTKHDTTVATGASQRADSGPDVNTGNSRRQSVSRDEQAGPYAAWELSSDTRKPSPRTKEQQPDTHNIRPSSSENSEEAHNTHLRRWERRVESGEVTKTTMLDRHVDYRNLTKRNPNEHIALPTDNKLGYNRVGKEPSNILDINTVYTDTVRFNTSTDVRKEADHTITVEQIKKAFDTNSLPPALQTDRTIKETIDQIYINNIKNPASMQRNLDELLQNNPDVARILESHFQGEQRDATYERRRLTTWADRNLQEPDRSNFKKDMADFEKRAGQDSVCSGDIAQTYRELSRLTSATGDLPINALERQHLAQQVMHQAAVPTSIDQGQHNTCNVTTIESRTYTRTPAEAAKLVVEVALTGQYRTGDGTAVNVNPKPHHESLKWPTVDGDRTHASEIFQVAAVNIHYARYGNRNIRYEQVEPNSGSRGDTGERLMDYSKKPPGEVVDASGKPLRRPEIDEGDLTDIINQISRRNEGELVIAAESNFHGSKFGLITVNSDQDLAAKMKWQKDHKRFPIIVRVESNNEPFFSDSGNGSAGGSGGAHVVTITDYDEKTGKVCIDNQWGKKADRGQRNAISIHDLYTAMHNSQGAEERLANDAKWNREHNISDPMKEMELLRMQRFNKNVNDVDYQIGVQKFIYDTKQRWDKGVSDDEKVRDRQEIGNLVHTLPPKDQVNLIIHQQRTGMLDTTRYSNELQVVGWKLGRDLNRDAGRTPQVQLDYQKAQVDLKRAMSIFTPEQQRAMLEKIASDIKDYP